MARTSSWVVAAGMLVVSVGCSYSQRVPDIKEEWVARLNQEQLAPIREAQDRLRAQTEQLGRAEAALTDTENRMQVASSLKDAAEARSEVAEKRRTLAMDRGEAAGVKAAEQEMAARQLELAEVESLERFRKAEDQEARARVSLEKAGLAAREAELNRAQYLALREAGDPRVAAMELPTFDAGLAERQEKVRELQANLAEKQQQVSVTQQRWDEATRRRAAAGRPTPTG